MYILIKNPKIYICVCTITLLMPIPKETLEFIVVSLSGVALGTAISYISSKMAINFLAFEEYISAKLTYSSLDTGQKGFVQKPKFQEFKQHNSEHIKLLFEYGLDSLEVQNSNNMWPGKKYITAWKRQRYSK